jgi:hypothetical protein
MGSGLRSQPQADKDSKLTGEMNSRDSIAGAEDLAILLSLRTRPGEQPVLTCLPANRVWDSPTSTAAYEPR